MVIMATIPLLERNAREHDQTAVSLGFLGCSSLYKISIMGVLSHYYHLFNQNFTGRRDSGVCGGSWSVSSLLSVYSCASSTSPSSKTGGKLAFFPSPWPVTHFNGVAVLSVIWIGTYYLWAVSWVVCVCYNSPWTGLLTSGDGGYH